MFKLNAFERFNPPFKEEFWKSEKLEFLGMQNARGRAVLLLYWMSYFSLKIEKGELIAKLFVKEQRNKLW
jgi:hypothetical protein